LRVLKALGAFEDATRGAYACPIFEIRDRHKRLIERVPFSSRPGGTVRLDWFDRDPQEITKAKANQREAARTTTGGANRSVTVDLKKIDQILGKAHAGYLSAPPSCRPAPGLSAARMRTNHWELIK
jgi:hypothetical protein